MDSLAMMMKPQEFKCKKKGNSEQLLQDFISYKKKMQRFFKGSKVVKAHTGVQDNAAHADHVCCPSCEQEKALILNFGGDEMERLFEHVGVVLETDTYHKAIEKVEAGIKKMTNQATARYKLFQEMPQDGQPFNSWSQLVREQADRCDWALYDNKRAARDAILYQMDDKKLRKKIIAEDTPLQEVIKIGVASEQAGKAADRLHGRNGDPGGSVRIAALEEQVRALSIAKKEVKVDTSCRTCTRPTHSAGKCQGLKVKCYDCGLKGHFKGASACKKPKKGGKPVRAVLDDSDVSEDDQDTDSDGVGRVIELCVDEVVHAATEVEKPKLKEETSKLSLTALDKGRPSQPADVNLLIDSGVYKTLLCEEDWHKVKQRPGDKPIKLKGCRTNFRPFGTSVQLPILGRTKCTLTAEAGAVVTTIVYVVKGESQSLLGLRDGKKLGIINIKPHGEVTEVVGHLTDVKKSEVPTEGVISGGETQQEIDRKMTDLVAKYADVFKGLGLAKVEPIHIQVDPDVKPVQQKPRPIAVHYAEKFKAHIAELKEAGVVSGPLGSEYARGWISNPVISGKKWDASKIRVTLDTRHMSKAVTSTHFPIPTWQELRHNFSGSDRYSVLDMNHAFHQFPMDDETKKLFVFHTPMGLFMYNTLVMGTAPASSECHENIRRMLEGIDGVQQIKDDLVVYGYGKEHDDRLEKVLQRLQEYGMTLRRGKCQFGVTEVKWFGQLYSKQGMSPDPDKVKLIKEWQAPASKTEVKSFLQTCQFSQPFMRPAEGRTYSDVTAPLRRLTVKSVRFLWDQKCQDSFDELKSLLCSDKVLANFDPKLETRVYVDHGPQGVASTLAQYYAGGGSNTGYWRPVSYQSRSLTKAERNYGKVDGESLAVLSGILANRRYLYGIRFTVVGDHQPLIPLYRSHSRELPMRVARHRSKLGGFDFSLIYEPGSTNPSDYASRHLPQTKRRYNAQERSELGVEDDDEEAEFIVNRIAHELPDAVSMFTLQHFTKHDKVLQVLEKDIQAGQVSKSLEKGKFKECFRELSVSNGLVLRGDKIVIPAELRPDVLAAAHEGHPGIVGMLRQLRQSVWWPGMTMDATEFVETCTDGCLPATPKNSPPPMLVRDTPDRPWQHVAADFKGPIVGNGKSYYFHVMIDLLSRWPEVTVVSSTSFDKLQDKLEDVFALHGVPETVTSDNGPPYHSKDWKNFGKQMGFQPIKVSPEHPEGNGVAERFMATIVKTTHAAIAQKKDPKLEIKRRLLNYRNTPHPSTGKTPSELMMGRIIRTRVPRLIKTSPTKTLQEARIKDKETRLARKEKHDKRKTAKEKKIEKGDRVLISQRKTTVKPPYDPKPYTVQEVKGTQVVVQRGEKTRVRNLGKVKILKQRPDHLKLKTHQPTNSTDTCDSDEEDWFDLPSLPSSPDEQNMALPRLNPDQPEPAGLEDDRSPTRRSSRRKVARQFLGVDQPSTSRGQLSPQQRKRNQSLARMRDRQRWSLKTSSGGWRMAEEGEEEILEMLTEAGDD